MKSSILPCEDFPLRVSFIAEMRKVTGFPRWRVLIQDTGPPSAVTYKLIPSVEKAIIQIFFNRKGQAAVYYAIDIFLFFIKIY